MHSSLSVCTLLFSGSAIIGCKSREQGEAYVKKKAVPYLCIPKPNSSCARGCMRSLKDHGKIVKSLRQIVLALQMNMKLLYVKVLLICLNRRAAQIVRLNSHR